MNVVSIVASQVDKIRNRLFLAGISRSEKVFLHTTRFTVSNGDTIERLRLWILVRAKGIAEAELQAESQLKELLKAYENPTTAEAALKNIKPRALTVATLHDESEGILHLLQTMRREAKRVVYSFERMRIS